MSAPGDPDDGASNPTRLLPQMQQPPILRIPQEIRDKIFRLVLKEPDVALKVIDHSQAQELRLYIEQQQLSTNHVLKVQQIETLGLRSESLQQRRHKALAFFHHDRQTSYNELLDTALLIVNKKFHLEASKILYEENTFTINHNPGAENALLVGRSAIVKSMSRVKITAHGTHPSTVFGLEKAVALITTMLSPNLHTLRISLALPTGGWIQSSCSQCVEMKWQAYESWYKALYQLAKLKVQSKYAFTLAFKPKDEFGSGWTDAESTTVEQKYFVKFLFSIIKDVAKVYMAKPHNHPSVVDSRRYRASRARKFKDWYDAQPKPLPAPEAGLEDDRPLNDWFSRLDLVFSILKEGT